MLKPIIAGQGEAADAAWPPSVRWALASLSLSMLSSALGISIANVGLPTIAQAFDASFQQVQWIVLAYLLAITTLIVGVGRLGDVTGRRRLLLAGILLFTLASGLGGIAPTLRLQRGVMSGMLNLSRNLGLITGASAMGAVFALASATLDITTARPDAVTAGMRTTFVVAGMLIVAALAIAVAAWRRAHQRRAGR